ncbi:hypothetical protein TeGR_g10377 [Tetraparma gracilis]|uniref:Leucine-rich repeat domain-containing protein n=1 Tax=Tetraparma gracilis TaxID=2962635 RepID=A0ABQ6MSS4_9STRA|nr:hypothetical protein TeGR_g10377 [Tetraparma gracilis]
MSKAVMYTGADPTQFNGYGQPLGEWQGDEEVAHVTIADGVTEIKEGAFDGCKGLTNLSFLKGSTITTVGERAYLRSGIVSLQWIEGVRKIGNGVFSACKDLCTIEGLGCEEMGSHCFAKCFLLQSLKGWPASMTVIPGYSFSGCTGMTTVDCDLSRVTSIGLNAFYGCTSLLPPSLSAPNADPAAVLAYLKRKSKDERMLARYAIYASVRRARDQEEEPRTGESPTEFAFALAKLSPDMNRLILEFKLGVVVPTPP